MKRKIFIFYFILNFIFSPVFSDETTEDEIIFPETAFPETANAEPDNNEIVYVIRQIEFSVDGRTRSSALIYYGEFTTGERIKGRENLESYLEEKKQLIMNQRVHNDITIEWSLGETEEDASVPVDLLINVQDTWNFIILPEPKYDSNEGFSLTLKTRDYNFFGTMEPLRLDIGYLWGNSNNGNRNILKLALDSDTPFYAGGFRWNLNFDNVLNWTAGSSLNYENTSGISIEIPAGNAVFNAGVNQFVFVNEENTRENIESYGLDEIYDGVYGASEIFTQVKIPTGINAGTFGEIFYTAKLSGKISYRPGGVDDPRRPLTSFDHGIGFGRINWAGNYRNGFEVKLENTNKFFFSPYDYRINLEAEAVYHKNFSGFFGISGRFIFEQYFNGSDFYAGEKLRGFLDNSIRTERMISLNLDFPLRAFRFAPSFWFNNRKLRLFDFDLHFSPFFDIALFKGSVSPFEKEDGSDFNKAFMGSGFEIIVFPDFFRSLYLRASPGYSVNKFFDTGKLPKWDELFIGIGHHY